MKEEVQHAVLTLRQQGLTTPEICQQLGLHSDVVIDILLTGTLSVPEQNRIVAVKRPVGRPQKIQERGLLASIAQALAERKTKHHFLWTFPDLLQVVRRTLRSDVSPDTLRRCLTRQGFTFADQLKQVVGESVPPDEVAAFSEGTILYVVNHQLHRASEGDRCCYPATTLITGVSAFNRLAVMAWPQSRLSSGMLVAFLHGLLTLHPDRHIAVILSAKKGVYQSVVRERSLNRDPRLQMYLAKK